MSETYQISSTLDHNNAERRVRAEIAHPKEIDNGYIGREDNPRVAEAMAYTAKPLIESALAELNSKQGTADEFVGWVKDEASTEKNVKMHPLSDPVIVNAQGETTSYRALRSQVKQAYEQAGSLQEKVYDDEFEAREIEVRAKKQAAYVRNRHI